MSNVHSGCERDGGKPDDEYLLAETSEHKMSCLRPQGFTIYSIKKRQGL